MFWDMFYDSDDFFVLLFFSLMCMLNDRFGASVRPNCFWSFTSTTMLSLKVSWGWFTLFFLQENSLLADIRIKFYFPLMSPLTSDAQVMVKVNSRGCRIPSYWEEHSVMSFSRSLMYTRNNKRPSADPFGTPNLIVRYSEKEPIHDHSLHFA